jgi:alkanesulfonate monooxygenase SsuD/methylene tetrahydromethanopterin reductase-like flavin-dependent oxidoreductase (luciferase family)
MRPAPAQAGGPPIVVAGRSAAAAARAATVGDGWMPYLCSPGWYDRSVRDVTVAAEEHDRDLSEFLWMVFLFVAVGDTDDMARRAAAAQLGAAYGDDAATKIDGVAAAGTMERVVDRIGQYVAVGARHIALAPCGSDRVSAIELVGRELLPRVRAASS